MAAGAMTPSRPYLVRALYDWIVDNDCTPYLIVAADVAGVRVPRAYVRDGRIVLNIAPRSVQGLTMGNADIQFNARFGGVAHSVSVPVEAVVAVYARENGQGMMFRDDLPAAGATDAGSVPEAAGDPEGPETPDPDPDDRPPRPKLRVVK